LAVKCDFEREETMPFDRDELDEMGAKSRRILAAFREYDAMSSSAARPPRETPALDVSRDRGEKTAMQTIDQLFKTTMQAADRGRGVLNKAAGYSRTALELRLAKAALLIDQAEASKSASPAEIREARIIVAARLALSQPREA
jgi:hypothetical protein